MADKKAMLNADPQRNTAFERVKNSIAEAMQPADAKSTRRHLPPDEQETILPIDEDEKPLYGQRLSTENNGGSGARASAAGAVVGAGVGADVGPGATTSRKDQGMIASAGEMVGKALGRK